MSHSSAPIVQSPGTFGMSVSICLPMRCRHKNNKNAERTNHEKESVNITSQTLAFLKMSVTIRADMFRWRPLIISFSWRQHKDLRFRDWQNSPHGETGVWVGIIVVTGSNGFFGQSRTWTTATPLVALVARTLWLPLWRRGETKYSAVTEYCCSLGTS